MIRFTNNSSGGQGSLLWFSRCFECSFQPNRGPTPTQGPHSQQSLSGPCKGFVFDDRKDMQILSGDLQSPHLPVSTQGVFSFCCPNSSALIRHDSEQYYSDPVKRFIGISDNLVSPNHDYRDGMPPNHSSPPVSNGIHIDKPSVLSECIRPGDKNIGRVAFHVSRLWYSCVSLGSILVPSVLSFVEFSPFFLDGVTSECRFAIRR